MLKQYHRKLCYLKDSSIWLHLGKRWLVFPLRSTLLYGCKLINTWNWSICTPTGTRVHTNTTSNKILFKYGPTWPRCSKPTTCFSLIQFVSFILLLWIFWTTILDRKEQWASRRKLVEMWMIMFSVGLPDDKCVTFLFFLLSQILYWIKWLGMCWSMVKT